MNPINGKSSSGCKTGTNRPKRTCRPTSPTGDGVEGPCRGVSGRSAGPRGRRPGTRRRAAGAGAIGRTLGIDYHAALTDPAGTAVGINAFLGGGLDETAMAAAVDPALRRQQATQSPSLGQFSGYGDRTSLDRVKCWAGECVGLRASCTAEFIAASAKNGLSSCSEEVDRFPGDSVRQNAGRSWLRTKNRP